MIYIPRHASDNEVLNIIRSWLGYLVREDYEGAFDALSDTSGWQSLIEQNIEGYRWQEYFPAEESFRVTDWRTAQGGNPERFELVQWLKPTDSLPLAGAVSYDLPLNGRWSDLRIDFVFWDDPECNQGFTLEFEEIFCMRQSNEEFDQRERAESTS